MRSFKKIPTVQLVMREDAYTLELLPDGLELRLSGKRDRQLLSFKQAETLAIRLMKLVNEQKCREVQDS